jgi:peptidoglycan/LPS O-acetylase OafA/YrhL
MNPTSTSRAYRPDIDGLRAAAVLCVVGYHAFPGALRGGFIGVDVFFVISGFLICGIILNDLEQGSFSLWNFYSRRIRRLFPALIVVLATVLIFGWFALFPDEYRALGQHVFGGASFISNFILWKEAGYFDVAAKAKSLLHLWSLGIEEQFYLVFPLLLCGCAKKHFRIATVVIALCLLSFQHNVYYMQRPTVNFYSPLTRVWALLAGAALRTAIYGGRRHKELYLKADAFVGKLIYAREQENDGRCLNLVLALSGAVLLALALIFVREDNPYPGGQALLPVLGAVFLIAAGRSNPISKHLLENRITVFTGLISYPFYLWHWVLISYAFIINGGFDASTRLLRVGLVAASFALAALTYFLVERPVRFGAWARKGKTCALIIGMAMVGAAGLSLRWTDGLPERERFKKPVAMTKQLDVLNDDYYWNKAGLSYAEIEKGQLSYCKFEDAGADETVAIIGDSHAASAYWGIAKLGRESGHNTVLLGWIIPAGEVWNKNNKNISIIFDILKKKTDITKVFICVRGMYYMTGLNVYPGDNPAAIDKNRLIEYDQYKRSLQSYIDTLRACRKDVFIISENPELPDLPRNYIARPLPFIPAKKFPALEQADVIKRQKEYLELLSEIRGATIIDTIKTFCPGEACLVFTEDGLPLYFDDDHLSPVGSDFQAEHILTPYLTKTPLEPRE